MRNTPRAGLALVPAAAAIAGMFAAAVWLQVIRDTRFPLPQSDQEALYLTRRAASRVVFTHRALAADLYWIRAIQYFGDRTQEARARSRDPLEPPAALAEKAPVPFDLLYPMLDIATTLDPWFNIAYRFGAIFLSEPYPHGPARPDQAIALLEKGIEVRPDKWEYLHDIGFVYYWNLYNYAKAAEAFNRAADIPGAPWWLRSLAATTLVKGGQRSASRVLWRQLYETATDQSAREAARTKLLQLDALETIEALQKPIDAFVARTGTSVTSWQTLVSAGIIRGIPLDPTGMPYELTSSSRVQLSSNSPLYPLPVEPSARSGP